MTICLSQYTLLFNVPINELMSFKNSFLNNYNVCVNRISNIAVRHKRNPGSTSQNSSRPEITLPDNVMVGSTSKKNAKIPMFTAQLACNLQYHFIKYPAINTQCYKM